MSNQKHLIIIGNEKGGAGKTTTSMHLIISLLKFGFKIASIDLDSRQQSLTRYIDNRKKYVEDNNIELLIPLHTHIEKSKLNNIEDIEKDEQKRLLDYINQLSNDFDFIVIDTPGSDTNMSRYAHSLADTIITPINDSFIDLDVLGSFTADSLDIIKAGVYSEMIWEQKLSRAKNNNKHIDWIVIRNRLSNIEAQNKKNMLTALKKLSKRLGFRNAKGFGERVIFRELFLKGLTLLDILEQDTNVNINLSHIAARRELRLILEALNIPKINLALGLSPDGKDVTVKHSIKINDDTE